jgi:hypothetical protein
VSPLARPTVRDISRAEVEQLVEQCLADSAGALGFRPDLHLDWNELERAPMCVVRAAVDALVSSLVQLGTHRGTTSAFVSVSRREDTIELCVVDDGRPGRGSRAARLAHLDEATGVEHDVDDFGGVGICQWWSIPLDL